MPDADRNVKLVLLLPLFGHWRIRDLLGVPLETPDRILRASSARKCPVGALTLQGISLKLDRNMLVRTNGAK